MGSDLSANKVRVNSLGFHRIQRSDHYARADISTFLSSERDLAAIRGDAETASELAVTGRTNLEACCFHYWRLRTKVREDDNAQGQGSGGENTGRNLPAERAGLSYRAP